MQQHLQRTLCGALALGAAALLWACDSGSSAGPADGEQGYQGAGLFGQVLGEDGSPLQGATVRAGGASGTTDSQGRYAFQASAGPTVIQVQAQGHLPWIQQRSLAATPTALQVQLLRRGQPQPLDSDAGGAVEGARGARVEVPASALVDPQGAAVSGTVEVALTPIDPSDAVQLQAAPGGLDARNEQQQPRKLESFGMMDITITQGDAELQVAPGQQLQIQIPAPAGIDAPPDELPLWSFDEEAGIWQQEGLLRWDQASQTYQGAIAHMSFWNADREQETTCITGQVFDQASGEPIAGAAVTAVGLDYNGYDGVTTDAQGRFVVLVRTDSQVRITAYHALDGAQARELASGSQLSGQPASLDDGACTDGGQWSIKRGELTLPDGTSVVCDPSAFGEIESCLPTAQRLFTCHNPQGSCQTNGNPLDLSYEFENGASVSTDLDLENSVLVQTYRGPGGVPCGTQTIDVNSSRITIELADGTTGTYGATASPDGSASYTCEDGSSFSLSAQTQALLQACSDTDRCTEGEGNNGSFGELCDTHQDCGELYCCLGICSTQELCTLPVCKEDQECGDGQQCCQGELFAVPICQAASACNGGLCEQDSDCQGQEICCDGQCTGNDGLPYCEGSCRDHQDCQDGQQLDFCCPNTEFGNYCTDSAQSCYQSAACTQDSDCGADSGLVCCDQDGEQSCQSAQDCYSNTPCSQEEPCQGGLTCCDRFVEDGLGEICLTAQDCSAGVACAQDSECADTQICCARADFGEQTLCLGQLECYLGVACGSDADCGGLACCSFQGQDLCLEACP